MCAASCGAISSPSHSCWGLGGGEDLQSSPLAHRFGCPVGRPCYVWVVCALASSAEQEGLFYRGKLRETWCPQEMHFRAFHFRSAPSALKNTGGCFASDVHAWSCQCNWSLCFFQVFIILGGANLHTPCIDDSAGRSRQKRFGINIIYHFLLRLQTANYHLHFAVCRNSRCLLGISACPWWVCLLLSLVPWQRWSRSPLSDLLAFSRGEGGNGLHNQHTCLFETLMSVSERQLLARCQLLAKLQHICLSSSDL